jgi:Fur family ferric uptake transcriptional regulator
MLQNNSSDLKAKTSPKASDLQWFWNNLDAYLAKKGLKQTKQRHRIVELFIGLNSHTSAEDLHQAAKREGQNIGLATVYRTLNILVDAGLVEQKSFREGHYVYEVRTPGEHHDHLICLDCGKVLEFENNDIEALQENIAQKYGFRLTHHRLDLYGRCQKNPCEFRPPELAGGI